MRTRLSDYQEQYGDLYNLEATPAESTTYRLAKHAYVLAFRDDHQTLIQIAVDSLGLPLGVQEQVERAAEGVLGTKTHLIISCTHTHFAPDGTDAAYQKQLVRCLNEAVASLRFEECSRLAYTLEQEYYDGLGRSRISSRPAEHVTLSLIGIWKDGRRWASLVCYNCHPTVLNGDTPYFSAEYPGEALRILHKRHPQEHFLFLQGAAGDISTRFTRPGQDYPSMLAMAARFAEEAEQLHSRPSRLQDISAISCRQKRIDLLHADGEGTLLTTKMCLLSPGRNPLLKQSEIEEKLKQYLNLEKVVWITDGIDPDETDGHIDDVACTSF